MTFPQCFVSHSRLLSSVGIALALSLISPNVQAAILAQYTFSTKDTAGFNASNVMAGMTATAVTRNTTGNAYGIYGIQNELEDGNLATYGANLPVLRMTGKSGASSFATALSSASYFSITLTPGSGNEIDLSSLTFNAARGGSSDTRGLAIFSSATGFDVAQATNYTLANAIFSREVTTVADNSFPIRNFTLGSYNVDLTGAAFQNITTATTFYFYVYTPGGGSIEMDNITFNGTVSPIPEPQKALLLVFALGSLLMRRRR